MTDMGKKLAILSGVVATIVVVVASLLFSDLVSEQWNIWRLGSSDESTRLHAVDKLVELKSVRSVPHLLRLIETDDPEEGRTYVEREEWDDLLSPLPPRLPHDDGLA